MNRQTLIHQRVFNDIHFADTYAKRHKKMAEKFGREYVKKLHSHNFKKGRILDMGCGFGGTDVVLANAFPSCEIIGVDLSEPLLQRADLLARSSNLETRLRFEKVDVHELPYEDNSFEVVLNINMLHIVLDPVKMLDEIERVLVPGGFLFIADIKRSWNVVIEEAFKSAMTLNEARGLFNQSRIREGSFSSNVLWWKFEA